MKDAYLKTGTTTINNIIDSDTGELLETLINQSTYLANTKEDFYLMYSSMLVNLIKYSKDTKVKFLAYIIQNYANGNMFSLGKQLKQIISTEIDVSHRSLDNCLTELVREKFLIKVDRNVYKLNPRHIFKGSSSERNLALKAILTLECPDC